jgi:hypothetical protein
MKRIFILLTFFSGFSFFAASAYSNCPPSLPDDNVNFCASFQQVAECHCVQSGLPKKMCQDMNTLYNRMVSVFGSLQATCRYQHDTSVQLCVDNWNCYRQGGQDSSGKLCNSTGKSCQ